MQIKSKATATKCLNAQILVIREELDKVTALAGDNCHVEIEAMRKALDKADALAAQLNFLE